MQPLQAARKAQTIQQTLVSIGYDLCLLLKEQTEDVQGLSLEFQRRGQHLN
jgi:hypothetical protein